MYLHYLLSFFQIFFFVSGIVDANPLEKPDRNLNTGPMICFNFTRVGVPTCRVVTSILHDTSDSGLYLASLSSRRDVADDAIKHPTKYMPIYVLDGMEVVDGSHPACMARVSNPDNFVCLNIMNKNYEIQHPCLMMYHPFDKRKRMTARVDCQTSLKEIILLTERHFSSFSSPESY